MKKIITIILKWIEKSLRGMATKVSNFNKRLNDDPDVRGGFEWMWKHHDELIEKYGVDRTIVIHRKKVVGVIDNSRDFMEQVEEYWKIYGSGKVLFQRLYKKKRRRYDMASTSIMGHLKLTIWQQEKR